MVVAIAVAPAFILSVSTAYREHAEAVRDALRYVRLLARTIASEQDRLFLEARNHLITLSREPAVASLAGGAQCGERLADFGKAFPRYLNIGVVRLDGSVGCSALAASPGTDLNDRDYFARAVRTKEFAVGSYQVGRITGKSSVNAAYPILDSVGAVHGAVFVAFDLSWLNELLRHQSLPHGVSARVIDANGVVLASYPSDADEVGEPTRRSDIKDRIVQVPGHPDGTPVDWEDERQAHMLYPIDARSPGGAFTWIAVSKDIVELPIRAELQRNLGLLAFAAIVVLLLAWTGSDYLVLRNVGAVAEAARRFAAGELGARTGLAQAPKELGTLARAFDGMAEAVQGRETDLRHATERLQRANRALRTLSASNRTLSRARDERELLQEMCRVAVEIGGYRAAWVGYALDDAAKRIAVMGHAGVEPDRIAELNLTWEDSEKGRGPTGTALRTGRISVSSGLDFGLGLGIKAGIALPLKLDGATLGAMAIYATDENAFLDDELKLLEEMVADLAFGIATIRTRIERDRAEEALRKAAFHDPETDLPNRRHLVQWLGAELDAAREQGRPVSLFVAGLQRFRELTQALGPRYANEVLRHAAASLREATGARVPVARLGEAELALAMPGTDLAGAGQAAKALLAEIERPFEVSTIGVDLQASIGIAVFPGHGADAEKLVRRASAAMSDAQKAGKGYAVRETDPEEEGIRRLTLIRDLRRAIDNGQLQAYYQPKVDARTRRVAGAEALVRWMHPERGMVPPVQFIPLAEQTGLIRTLTYEVLRLVARQLFAWGSAGHALPVAINLSAENLRDAELIPRIEGHIATWGLNRELLQFEITESTLMEDPAVAMDMLTRLSESRIHLAIDDFGTGYSSLSYLATLPVHTLKIDRSFVNNMDRNPQHREVVLSVLSLARALNLKVVAEGVETAAQADFLAAHGCDELQGYLFSAPLPADKFGQWLGTYQG